MRLRSFAAGLIFSTILIGPRAARAVDVGDVGGKPLVIDVTNTSIFNYRFNNRNDADNKFSTKVDDNYGEWLDRLNIQASYWQFRLGVRVDAATYIGGINEKKINAIVADQTNLDTDARRNSARNQYFQELNTRFRQTYYPSKLWVGWSRPGIDITVGDFYVQLGRGLVFSVRKVDELAIDTTVRGIKVQGDYKIGPVTLRGTLFGGQMNPLRVDEQSGRRLNGFGSPLFFGFPTALPSYTYDYNSDTGKPYLVTDLPRPNYIEDAVVGGRVEANTKWVNVAFNAAALLRRSLSLDYQRCLSAQKDRTDNPDGSVTKGACAAQFPAFSNSDASRIHDQIVNIGGSVHVPAIAKKLDLYVEVAGQLQSKGQVKTVDPLGNPTTTEADLRGLAVYANASLTLGPVSASAEFKHYRSFYPLTPNLDITTPGFSGPEFSLITYSLPPTVEPIFVEPIAGAAPNLCIDGGRVRVDYRFNRDTSVYAWAGHYWSWSELSPNNSQCDTSTANKTTTWDAAVGIDLAFEGGRTFIKPFIGARTTDGAGVGEVSIYKTDVFYREGYIRYDIAKNIKGPFTLHFLGFHRYRYEPTVFEHSWVEGENYTSLEWSPHLAATFGYEYQTKEGCRAGVNATLTKPAVPQQDLCHYFNGGITWRSNAGGKRTPLKMLFDTVTLFVGQRRGALRCISGVCRQFPPFEGAKLELVSRF